MTKVKICGITTVADAVAVANAGADFIGLVLSPSPRQMDINKLSSIVEAVSGRSAIVGVFASPTDLLAFDHESDALLDYYQVYFDHSNLEVRLPRQGLIRSFWINGSASEPLVDHQGLLLCDFKKSSVDAMRQLCSTSPELVHNRTFIAGNLTVDNVDRLVKAYKPFGVDVARGTESSPGIKDMKKVEEFIRRVRNA